MARARTLPLALFLALAASPAHAEVILQWFETPWSEVEARIPEVAAAGYGAIWLPPPTKGSDGVADVGFALFDRFDLGDRDQRGTVRTRYGTLAELQSMVRTAHRFGIRVYFDTIMNHNSNPSRVEFQGGPAAPPNISDYPGMTALDFHLLPATDNGDGTFNAKAPPEMGGGMVRVEKQDNDAWVASVRIADIPAGQLPPEGVNHPKLAGFTHLVRPPHVACWDCVFESQNYTVLGLVDISNEEGGINLTIGTPQPSYIRFPDRPETYPNNTPVAEDTPQFLMRWITWLSQQTDADGFRLDAIKHTPKAFFGYGGPGDTVAFNKVIQDSYDERRALADANDDDMVDDAAIFGESYTGTIDGTELSLMAYRSTGMRLLNFPLFFNIKGTFYSGDGAGNGDLRNVAFPRGGQAGATQEFGGLGRWDGVSFAQSHDECPPGTPVRNVPRCDPGANAQDDLAQAFISLRVGDSVVFFDGNNFTDRTFVRAGRPDALGDMDDVAVRIAQSHQDAARGGQFNRYADADAYVFERVVDGFGAAALVVLHDTIQGGPDAIARFGGYDPRPLIVTAFPAGTELVEITGNAVAGSEQLTVLSPSQISTEQEKTNAYAAHASANENDTFVPPDHGLVYFGVRNGPAHNFLVYVPKSALAENAVLEVLQGGSAAPTRSVTSVPAKTAFTGDPLPAATYVESLVNGAITLRVALSSGTGVTAGILVDNAVPAGLSAVTGSPEKLLDGMGGMTVTGTAAEASLAALEPGRHSIKVRVVTPVPGAAARVVTLRAVVSAEGAVVTDGGVLTRDAAVPDAASAPDAAVVVADAGAPDAARPDAAGGADAAVAPDAAVADGSVSTPDASPGTPDAAVVDGGLEDNDHDGIPAFRDNCPAVSNADQADFDEDGVGDSCDQCPDSPRGRPVDGQGCPRLSDTEFQKLVTLVEMVAGLRPADMARDENLDGTLDAVDMARAVLRAQQE